MGRHPEMGETSNDSWLQEGSTGHVLMVQWVAHTRDNRHNPLQKTKWHRLRCAAGQRQEVVHSCWSQEQGTALPRA